MHFVVTGGGTGGHIYPALAIARGLMEKYPGATVHYLGSERGLEKDIVPRAGLEFTPLPLAGLQRRLTPHNLRAGLLALAAVGRVRRLLKARPPAAVIGTGGYVCGPVVLAAASLGIPTLIHEQNAFPGLTNRWLARLVNAVALTFPEAAPHFKGRARKVVTGLPVRPELLQADRDKCRQNLGLLPGQLLILAFGGSQGARSINLAMLDMCRQLAGRTDVCLLHVTGPAQYEWFCRELGAAGINEDKFANINIKPYLHNMPAVLGAADLVICRAGAATIAEITVLGLPSILIPYPYAAANHQVHNARALVRAGAAVMIHDAELSGPLLQQKVGELLENRPLMASMARSAAALGRPRALEEILDTVAAIMQRGG